MRAGTAVVDEPRHELLAASTLALDERRSLPRSERDDGRRRGERPRADADHTPPYVKHRLLLAAVADEVHAVVAREIVNCDSRVFSHSRSLERGFSPAQL